MELGMTLNVPNKKAKQLMFKCFLMAPPFRDYGHLFKTVTAVVHWF